MQLYFELAIILAFASITSSLPQTTTGLARRSIFEYLDFLFWGQGSGDENDYGHDDRENGYGNGGDDYGHGDNDKRHDGDDYYGHGNGGNNKEHGGDDKGLWNETASAWPNQTKTWDKKYLEPTKTPWQAAPTPAWNDNWSSETVLMTSSVQAIGDAPPTAAPPIYQMPAETPSVVISAFTGNIEPTLIESSINVETPPTVAPSSAVLSALAGSMEPTLTESSINVETPPTAAPSF